MLIFVLPSGSGCHRLRLHDQKQRLRAWVVACTTLTFPVGRLGGPHSKAFFILLNMEIFRTIIDFPNYEVSNLGRVRHKRTGRISGYKAPHGYIGVDLRDSERKKRRFLIHRLVMISFLGLNPDRPVVNHKDGDKTNNNIENLEWCTVKENTRHAFDTGLRVALKGERHWCRKLREIDVIEIRRLALDGVLRKDIAQIFNVGTSIIGDIILRKRWRHI